MKHIAITKRGFQHIMLMLTVDVCWIWYYQAYGVIVAWI